MMRQVSQEPKEPKKPTQETQETQLPTLGGHHESWEQGAAPGLRKGLVGEKDEEGRQSGTMLDYVGLDKCQRLFILVVLTYV